METQTQAGVAAGTVAPSPDELFIVLPSGLNQRQSVAELYTRKGIKWLAEMAPAYAGAVVDVYAVTVKDETTPLGIQPLTLVSTEIVRGITYLGNIDSMGPKLALSSFLG